MGVSGDDRPATWADLGTTLCALARHIDGSGLLLISRLTGDEMRLDVLRRAAANASAVVDLVRTTIEGLESACAARATKAPSRQTHACDLPGCASCGNPEAEP